MNGALPIPVWVILAAHAAIALGTLTGGWRIIHTMGSKITKLTPVGGFAAETAGADLALHGDAPRRAASARRTRSPARSSASGRSGGCRPCAGASPAGSCGPGC